MTGRGGAPAPRVAVVVAITAAWSVVYAVATLAMPGTMPARAVIADSLFLPGHALAAWALWHAWRAQPAGSASQQGFAALFLSQAVGVGSTLSWIATSAGLLPALSVTYQAVSALTTLLTVVGAARLVPFRRPGAASVPWLDIALLGLAGLSIGWYFVGWPLLLRGTDSTAQFTWWALLTSADTFVSLLFIAAWTYPSERLHASAAAWFGLAYALSTWGDIHIKVGAGPEAYVSGHPVDILFAVIILVTAFGAWQEVAWRDGGGRDPVPRERRMVVGRSAAPLIATAAVIVPGIVGFLRRDPREAFFVPISLTVAFLFILQWRQLLLDRVIARTLGARFALERDLALARQFESLGRYAGAIAHDFNNTLAGLQGHVQLLRLGAVSVEDLPGVLGVMEDAVARGVRLNRRLVGLVRGAAVQPEPTDLGALVRSVMASIAPVIPPSVSVRLSLPRHPVVVDLPPGDGDQLLLNLVVNARDAMPAGGGIEVRVRAEASDAVLEVEDTGAGIPADIRERIFEPLFTTKGAQRGTGLGLATVQAVVTNAHGSVAVWSEEGRGTRFTVRLPRSERPAEPLARGAAGG